MKAVLLRCGMCDSQSWNYDLVLGMCIECYIRRKKAIDIQKEQNENH